MTSYTQLRGQVDGIRHGAVPDWLTRALVKVATAPDDATVLCHPLGFLCVPVWRFDEGGVCVHVWTRRVSAARPTTSPVHCHSWDLYSLVLAGEVHNHLPRVVPVAPVRTAPVRMAPVRMAPVRMAPAPTHRLFDVHSHHDMDEIHATGELVRCEPGRAESVRAGDVYAMAAGTFHLTDIVGGEAATLVLAHNRPGGRDRTVGAVYLRDHRVQRAHSDSITRRWAARAVLQLLTGPRLVLQPM
ncbi:hypothetical protein [Frankia sp. Cr2]|uniref:hypothetical protein n=1 Tax=Frankia sp. Cr2 TaxID=3073932 RepID=UPI002AD50E42|nr:hypothetical protein [Frankia sp. Cr2]